MRPYLEITQHKKAGGVAQGIALSSNPSIEKKKESERKDPWFHLSSLIQQRQQLDYPGLTCYTYEHTHWASDTCNQKIPDTYGQVTSTT
jgi:hypothetical protein